MATKKKALPPEEPFRPHKPTAEEVAAARLDYEDCVHAVAEARKAVTRVWATHGDFAQRELDLAAVKAELAEAIAQERLAMRNFTQIKAAAR